VNAKTSFFFIREQLSLVFVFVLQKINDPYMKLSARTSERFETTFQVYREAASGANGGKTGGGCGCN
jgi:hypothetical protein